MQNSAGHDGGDSGGGGGGAAAGGGGGGVHLSAEHLVSYGTLGIMLACIVMLAVCLCMVGLVVYCFWST